jgi:hypothetical protein
MRIQSTRCSGATRQLKSGSGPKANTSIPRRLRALNGCYDDPTLVPQNLTALVRAGRVHDSMELAQRVFPPPISCSLPYTPHFLALQPPRIASRPHQPSQIEGPPTDGHPPIRWSPRARATTGVECNLLIPFESGWDRDNPIELWVQTV